MTTASAALAEQLAGVRGNELEHLQATVRAYALDKGLIVLPATIDTADTIVLDANELTVHEALDAAVACGARAVYLRQATVIAAAVLHALPAEHGQDQALQAELARVDGWVTDVEVGFALAGLAHVWSTTTSWSDVLADITSASRLIGGERSAPHAAESTLKYLADSEIERWAATLAADKAFCRAATPADRDAAADALPGLVNALDGCDGWQLGSIIGTATRKVRDLAEQRAAELKPRLDEFAATLATDTEYAAISAAAARKRYAAEWIVDQAAGLRLPTWWIDDLVGRAKLASKAPKTTGKAPHNDAAAEQLPFA